MRILSQLLLDRAFLESRGHCVSRSESRRHSASMSITHYYASRMFKIQCSPHFASSHRTERARERYGIRITLNFSNSEKQKYPRKLSISIYVDYSIARSLLLSDASHLLLGRERKVYKGEKERERECEVKGQDEYT